MAKQEKTYTYRNGEKIYLTKSPDEFVVRELPDKLGTKNFDKTEKVSSASSRVTVNKNELDQRMIESRNEAVTHHAYYTEEAAQEFLITDRIIVTFKKAIASDKVDAFAAKYALRLLEKYSDKDYLFMLTDHTGMNPLKLIVKLTESEPLVQHADNDLNQRMEKYSLSIPTDTVYQNQWHLHKRFINPQFDTRSSSRCEEAWQLLDNFGSSDVVIGVTDDGCKLNHGDFNSPDKFVNWGYFKNSRLMNKNDIDANPLNMYETGANHGTSCNGVIGAEADGVLTVGAAPGCMLCPIKWESDGPYLLISDSKFLTGLNFISDKVDVLSNSWGSSPTALYASYLKDKISQLALNGGRRGKGIVFLFAAGNENCPISFDTTLNVPYTDGYDPDWNWIGVQTSKHFAHNLVGIPGVMYVAALSSNAQRSHYSNYGDGIDLCAPSNNLHQYQRMTVTGLDICTTSGQGSGIDFEFGGTSSATPLAAGICGLVISANPDLSALEVISILKQTASKDLNMSGYSRTPAASYDTNISWDISPVTPHNAGTFKNIGNTDGTWSSWFGHGKVDAFEAVKKAMSVLVHTGNNSIKIISALVNPAGTDAGNEKISLLNKTSSNINLSGWSIQVKTEKQPLNGQIIGGGTLTINVDNSKINLANTGANIILWDSANNKVDEVTYVKNDVRSGQAVVF